MLKNRELKPNLSCAHLLVYAPGFLQRSLEVQVDGGKKMLRIATSRNELKAELEGGLAFGAAIVCVPMRSFLSLDTHFLGPLPSPVYILREDREFRLPESARGHVTALFTGAMSSENLCALAARIFSDEIEPPAQKPEGDGPAGGAKAAQKKGMQRLVNKIAKDVEEKRKRDEDLSPVTRRLRFQSGVFRVTLPMKFCRAMGVADFDEVFVSCDAKAGEVRIRGEMPAGDGHAEKKRLGFSGESTLVTIPLEFCRALRLDNEDEVSMAYDAGGKMIVIRRVAVAASPAREESTATEAVKYEWNPGVTDAMKNEILNLFERARRRNLGFKGVAEDFLVENEELPFKTANELIDYFWKLSGRVKP